MVSDLKINMRKTKVVRIGDRRDEERLAMVLGCKTTTLPIKSSGLPLRANSKIRGHSDNEVFMPYLVIKFGSSSNKAIFRSVLL